MHILRCKFVHTTSNISLQGATANFDHLSKLVLARLTMSVVVQERFREHVAVAEALRANYSSRDDLNRVHAVQQLETELSELCRRQEKGVQSVLRGDKGHLIMYAFERIAADCTVLTKAALLPPQIML